MANEQGDFWGVASECNVCEVHVLTPTSHNSNPASLVKFWLTIPVCTKCKSFSAMMWGVVQSVWKAHGSNPNSHMREERMKFFEDGMGKNPSIALVVAEHVV